MLLWIGFPFIIVPRFLLREEQFKNWQISLNHIFERVTDIKRAALYERKLKQKVFSTFGGLKIMLFHKLKSLSWSLTLWSDVERAFLSSENIRLRYRKLGKSKKVQPFAMSLRYLSSLLYSSLFKSQSHVCPL